NVSSRTDVDSLRRAKYSNGTRFFGHKCRATRRENRPPARRFRQSIHDKSDAQGGWRSARRSGLPTTLTRMVFTMKDSMQLRSPEIAQVQESYEVFKAKGLKL